MAGPSYLEQFKTKYPQFKNVPDGQLAKAIYDQHYAKTMGWSEFTKAIGYDAPPTLPAQVSKAASRQPEAVKWDGNLAIQNVPTEFATQPLLAAGKTLEGAAKFTRQGLEYAAGGAIIHSEELATELYDLVRHGGFPNNLPDTSEKYLKSTTYQPKGEGIPEVEWVVRHPVHLLAEVGNAIKKSVGRPLQQVASKTAEHVLSDVSVVSPQEGALLAAGIKSAPKALGVLLMTDNPVTRGIGELSDTLIAQPAGKVTSMVKAATRDAIANVANRTTRFAGRVATSAQLANLRAYEDGMYALNGQQLLVDHDASEMIRQGAAQLSQEDLTALEKYYEDPSQSYPLTPKQKAFASMFIEPKRAEVDMQPGYVPRVSLEHANFEVSAMRGEAEAARPRAYKHLSTDVDAFKSRGWYRLVPEDGGEPLVAHLKQYQNPDYPGQYQIVALRNKEMQDFPTQRVLPEDGTEAENVTKSPVGASVADLKGNKYRIETATREEITRHSGRQFVANPVYTTARAWHQIRTAQLTEMQKELTKRILGQYIRKGAERVTGDVPIESRFFKDEGNQPLYAPPSVARVVESFMGNPRSHGYLAWRQLNHLILNASFVVPVWHDENMVSMALMEKLPRALEQESWTNFGRAHHEVLNVSGQYRELVAKGYPFWTPRVYPQTLHETAGSLLREMDTEHAQWLMTKTGMSMDMVKSGLKWYRDNVMHSVGPISDTLTMSAIKERMAIYKEDLDTAAKKVFRSMPQYRIRPTQAMLHSLQEAQIPLFWFLPYHVDRVAILWRRLKGAASGNPEDLTRLAGNIMMATVVYPRLDQALRDATNNPKAHIERFGANRIVADVYGAGERTQPDARLLGDLLTENGILAAPSSLVTEAYRMKKNPSLLEQAYGEQPQYPSHVKQLEHAAGYLPIYPLQNYLRGGATTKSAVLGQLGIFTPKSKAKPTY